MTPAEANADRQVPAWAPDSCTLPTAERPVRAAEFSALWADALRGVRRPAPTRLLIDLHRQPRVAARAAELALAETRCCSFFTFTLTVTDAALTLAITAPEQHAAVLDALAAGCQSVLGRAR